MKQIAIVYTREMQRGSSYDYDSFTEIVATSITEWTEVSDEDYLLLVAHSQRSGKYTVITRDLLNEESETVARSVAEQLAYVKRQQQKQAAENAARERAEAERKAKKAATAQTRKLKQLQKLQAELGMGTTQ